MLLPIRPAFKSRPHSPLLSPEPHDRSGLLIQFARLMLTHRYFACLPETGLPHSVHRSLPVPWIGMLRPQIMQCAFRRAVTCGISGQPQRMFRSNHHTGNPCLPSCRTSIQIIECIRGKESQDQKERKNWNNNCPFHFLLNSRILPAANGKLQKITIITKNNKLTIQNKTKMNKTFVL